MADRHRAKNAPKSKTRRKKGRHRAKQRHTETHVWLGAGAVALGVGAALATGSGTAHADGITSGGSSASAGSGKSSSSSGTTSGSSAGMSSATGAAGAPGSSTGAAGAPGSSTRPGAGSSSSSSATGAAAGGHTSQASTVSPSGGNLQATTTASSATSNTPTGSASSPSTSTSTGSASGSPGPAAEATSASGSPGPTAKADVTGSTGSTTSGASATSSTGAATTASSRPSAHSTSNTRSGPGSTVNTTAATGQGAGLGAAAAVTSTSSTGATGSIGSSAGASPASTVASSNTTGPVSAAAAVTTSVTPAAAPAAVTTPVTNPLVNLLAGALSFFGLNTPVAPSNPLGALVWGVFRTVETGFGLVPVAGTPTVGTPTPPTGAVTGTLGFTEPAGLPLTYTVTANPTQGSVTVDTAGAFTYTPNAAAVTQSVDTFTVTASDGLAATNKTVTVPVGSAGGSQVHGIVSLHMVAVTEPVIDISVNGGPSVPVLVDTGSAGLVIGAAQYVGQQNLGASTGSGASGYSGGLTYSYNTYTTTVDFGNGIVTAPTSVDVVSAASQQAFTAYFAPAGVVGVLGIGPNAGGPGPSIVIAALPGELGNGVLINESQGLLEFGPNPLPTLTSVAGAPYTSLEVKVGNGPLEPVTGVIDSGGVYGTIPSSVIGGNQLSGNLPAGTVISVYTADGQTLLYSYTTTATNTPTVTAGGAMDTGYTPFAQGPVYIAYSGSSSGTTVFDV
jgi:hypothetical protein